MVGNSNSRLLSSVHKTYLVEADSAVEVLNKAMQLVAGLSFGDDTETVISMNSMHMFDEEMDVVYQMYIVTNPVI